VLEELIYVDGVSFCVDGNQEVQIFTFSVSSLCYKPRFV
jgi:hypothetical protein